MMTRWGLLAGLLSLLLIITAGKQATPLRIAVMSAFEAELKPLLDQVENPQVTRINGVTFTSGTLAEHEVVLATSGVSMVNAAMTTQLLFDHFDISQLVYTGIAGSLNPELHIGDVIAPRQWGQHQQSIYAREIDGEFAPPDWANTEFGNFGMIFPQPLRVRSETGMVETFWFKADADMLAAAADITSAIQLNACNTANVCLDTPPSLIIGGYGLSGQAFIDNAEFREYAFKTFDAEVIDMESAAVAQVAYANDIPFIIFRGISDLAGGNSETNEIEMFYDLAAGNSAIAVMALLERLRQEA